MANFRIYQSNQTARDPRLRHEIQQLPSSKLTHLQTNSTLQNSPPQLLNKLNNQRPQFAQFLLTFLYYTSKFHHNKLLNSFYSPTLLLNSLPPTHPSNSILLHSKQKLPLCHQNPHFPIFTTQPPTNHQNHLKHQHPTSTNSRHQQTNKKNYSAFILLP